MPGDDQANDTARLNNSGIDSSNHGGDDLSDEATAEARLQAEARLRQEAAQMRVPPSYTRGIRDVTSEFVAASQQLPPGELVKDEYFTLFEAVGALEIMDPKMDSGFIEEGDPFEPDFDVTAGREPGEVIWIMDKLLCHEMSFHQGYPLSQNVFTSLHVFRLIDPETKPPYHLVRDEEFELLESCVENDDQAVRNALVHVVLEAYCIGLIKCVEVALQSIQSQTYYEEEDFVTYLFGRELCPKVSAEESRRRLIEANNWIHDHETALGEELAAAMQTRIQSRISMLLMMTAVEPITGVQLNIICYEGHDLARPIPEAFSDKVQRQLATSTPPRPQPTIEWTEACDLWVRLCSDLAAIEQLSISEARRKPQSLLRAVWTFGYRDPHPNTYARAKMQEMLTLNEAVGLDTPHQELLLADIRDLVLPGCETADPASFEIEVPSHPCHKSSEVMNSFMSMVYGDWLNLYIIPCQNRCRMRRCFTQALTSWSKLLEAAPQYDRQLNHIRSHGVIRGNDGGHKHYKPLTHWARHHFTQLTRWVVQLGFETDIYLRDEYLGMYHLFKAAIMPSEDEHISPLERLHGRTLEHLRSLGERSTSNKPRELAWQKECKESVKYIEAMMMLQAVENRMATTLRYLFGLLEHMGIIVVPTRSDEEARLRQEARLKPFLAVITRDKAEMLQADVSGQQCRNPGGIPDDDKYITRAIAIIEDNKRKVLGGIGGLAKLAKDAKANGPELEREWANELQLLKRATFDIGINAQRILQICQAHGGLTFEEDKDYNEIIEMTILPAEQRQHKWWVVPQISEKKKAA